MTRTTIGVAIAVPEPHGSMLRRMRADFGDPQARTVPTHVTLLPPCEVDVDDLDDIRARLDKVAGTVASFPMSLRGTGTFRPISPVVFVALRSGAAETELLADELRKAVAAAPPEFAFHPHVTVGHHLDDAALDHAHEALRDFECSFMVAEFALYLHCDEAGWEPHDRFSLVPGR